MAIIAILLQRISLKNSLRVEICDFKAIYWEKLKLLFSQPNILLS